MRPPLSRRLLAIALSCASSCTALARADETSDRAYELYRLSAERYRAGQFKEAADLVRQAYAIHRDPVLLYNLGRACDGMGDLPCAIDAYERYLAASSPPDRGAIEQRIETFKAELAERAAKEQHPPPRTAARGSVLPWVVASVGAVGVGAGVAMALVALKKHDDAASDPVQSSAASEQASAESLMTAANVTLVAGALGAAAGVAWIVLEPKSQASVAVGPGALRLMVNF
jgi:tetratricopeptide (TPR) repeat protein